MEKGDLTVGEVYEVFPFGNTLYVLDLTGKEIKETLEITGVTYIQTSKTTNKKLM